jgi:hypothetical protein
MLLPVQDHEYVPSSEVTTLSSPSWLITGFIISIIWRVPLTEEGMGFLNFIPCFQWGYCCLLFSVLFFVDHCIFFFFIVKASKSIVSEIENKISILKRTDSMLLPVQPIVTHSLVASLIAEIPDHIYVCTVIYLFLWKPY